MHYFGTRTGQDSFSDPSLLAIVDFYQLSELSTAVEFMVLLALRNGLPLNLRPRREKTVQNHISIFGPPALRGLP